MSKNPAKSKCMMYEQQLAHLPLGNMDNVVNAIESMSVPPKRYAVIQHDKDIDANNNPIEPHIHAMMTFENARSWSNVAKELSDVPQSVEAWKHNEGNGYAYLCHRTKNAVGKFQYDPALVKANFDYPAELERITRQVEVASHSNSRISFMLDALYDGTITKQEIESQLTGSQYARYHRQIDDVNNKRLRDEAKAFREQMIAEGRKLQVIWIYGETGTGKTSLAREYAKKSNQEYYITGSSKDLFQSYNGQHTIIIDELRSGTIQYQDLLRILDPYGEQVYAPARYSDKALACDLIIITSPYNPLEFFDKTFGFNENYKLYRETTAIDKFEQLLRRISLVIEMNEFYIRQMLYDNKNMNFYPTQCSRQNSYYNRNQKSLQTNDSEELFNSMFDD